MILCLPLELAAVDVRIETRRSLPNSSVWELLGTVLRTSLRVPHSDSWESSIEAGARKSAVDIIGPQLGELVGISTLTVSGEDILVARWKPIIDSQFTSIWAWDTPQFNYMILECSLEAFGSPAQAERFIKTLIVWKVPTLELSSITAAVRVGTHANGTILVGSGQVLPPYPYGVEFSLSAIQLDRRAYLVVKAGKGLFSIRHYPEGASYVLERFPPLRNRVQTWSQQEILEEGGKAYTLTGPISRYDNRDAVLIQELVRRGVSEIQMEQLMLPNLDDIDLRSQRMFRVLRTLKQSNGVKQYNSAISNVLKRLENENPPQERLLELLLRELREGVGTGANFSEFAVGCITRGIAMNAALLYLEYNCDSTALFQKLSQTDVPELYHASKESTLNKIKVRLTERTQPK